MSNLQEFVNQDFGKLRTTLRDGEPWFVAKDICDALDVRTDTVRTILDDDEVEKINLNTNTIGVGGHGGRSPLIVSEAGLYALILKSRKPNARVFRRWVTHEVLPQIRQTGGYVAEDRESEFVEKYFPSFKDETKLSMVQDLLKTNKKYKAQIKSLQPKAEAYKDLMTAEGYVNFIDLASVVEIGRTKLLDFLRSEKVLTKQSQFNVPYGRFTKNGYFATIHEKGRDGKIGTVTMVSPRGIDYIYHLIKKRHKESDFDMRKVVA